MNGTAKVILYTSFYTKKTTCCFSFCKCHRKWVCTQNADILLKHDWSSWFLPKNPICWWDHLNGWKRGMLNSMLTSMLTAYGWTFSTPLKGNGGFYDSSTWILELGAWLLCLWGVRACYCLLGLPLCLLKKPLLFSLWMAPGTNSN